MRSYSAFRLFSISLLAILSVAKISLSNEIDDKLNQGLESLQKALKAKCGDKSIPNGITKVHVKECIEKCAKPHLDNPPDNLKIPDKIYPKKFNQLMSECLSKAKGNLCDKKVVDSVVKCAIKLMIIHVSEAKNMYNKNQESVAKLAETVFPCLDDYIKSIK